jgi:uncharacterized repeat protein (TIGR03803 family)
MAILFAIPLVLHTFEHKVGENPSGLFLGQSGNLFGTALVGGDMSCNGGQGCGTVFKISPRGKLTNLYSFQGQMEPFRLAELFKIILQTSMEVRVKAVPAVKESSSNSIPRARNRAVDAFTGGADGAFPEGVC